LHIVNFAAGIQNNSSTAVDNVFVDNSRINLSSVSPILNGLSHHDAHVLTIKNIYATINKFLLNQGTRLIDKETIMNFQTVLKLKTWKSVNVGKDPNHMFNLFLCILLNISQVSVPIKHKIMKDEGLDCIRSKNILQIQKTSVCLH
jgi:hypothetical protein